MRRRVGALRRARVRWRRTSRGALVVAALLTGGATLMACGASSPPPRHVSQIEVNWTTFFNGTTPAARRIALLQNGPAFASVITAQSKTALAKSVSVTVTKVTVTTPTSATVRYTLRLSGTPLFTGQIGTAVKQNGTWKVSIASFCPLLALEQLTPPACSSG